MTTFALALLFIALLLHTVLGARWAWRRWQALRHRVELPPLRPVAEYIGDEEIPWLVESDQLRPIGARP